MPRGRNKRAKAERALQDFLRRPPVPAPTPYQVLKFHDRYVGHRKV
jgi:hypothetical protein